MQTKCLCVCLNTYSTDSEAQSIDYICISMLGLRIKCTRKKARNPYVLCKYFSTFVEEFRILHSFNREETQCNDVASVLQRIHCLFVCFFTSTLPQFHFELGIQDKKNESKQQNIFFAKLHHSCCVWIWTKLRTKQKE